jgi:multidrug efflux pump subunit AcrB
MGYSNLEVSIQGENPNAIENTAKQLFAQLQGVKGLANLSSEFRKKVRGEAVGRLG